MRDWRSTVPVWAMLELIRLREGWRRGIDAENAPGEVLGARLVVMPAVPGEDLDADRFCMVRVRTDRGSVRDLMLWDNRVWLYQMFGETDPTQPPGLRWPEDEITGWPDHYIVNGDPSGCGCPEHFIDPMDDDGETETETESI